MKKLLLSLVALMILSSCGGPTLPDPRFEFPAPPAELMKEPPKMEPIKETK